MMKEKGERPPVWVDEAIKLYNEGYSGDLADYFDIPPHPRSFLLAGQALPTLEYDLYSKSEFCTLHGIGVSTGNMAYNKAMEFHRDLMGDVQLVKRKDERGKSFGEPIAMLTREQVLTLSAIMLWRSKYRGYNLKPESQHETEGK